MGAFAAVLLTAAVVAQAAPASPPATSLIAGRVVDGLSNRPVAGAIVSLSGAGLGTTPRAMTNANGYFVFRQLTKGAYSLSASRPGFVDGAPGRRRPGGMAAAVEIEEGQRIADVVIPIWRHATISGTVTDEAGEPVIGAQVTGFQRRLAGGRYRMVRRAVATTDDRGVYRLVSLEPGDYLVAFVWRDTSVPLATAELMRMGINGSNPQVQQMVRERLTLQPNVGIPGSAATIQVGGSVRDLPPGLPPPPSSDSAVFIYPTQFYPGMPSAGRATVVTVTSGQDRLGIDLALTPTKTVTVSGTLIGPDGLVASTALRLIPTGDSGMTELETSATMTDPQGGFTFLGVTPGQYVVAALRTPAPRAAAADDATLFAATPVTVGNRDVSDLLVTLQHGARVAGRVEFDGTRDRPDAAAMMGVAVTLERLDADTSALPPGHADTTGAFKTPGAPPGRYLVRVAAPSGWTLREVMAGGRDVSETPLDLHATDVNDVIITFTDGPTRVAGSARTSDGHPDPDAVVIAFPVDQSAWSDYGANPRRVRSTHAARNGSYTISGLPPGEYCLVAIHEDITSDWQDPRLLDGLARSGSRVRLAEGDARLLDLTAVRGASK
jgi:protocatechuate 3,4-dioxygenase beta subunit